MNLVYYNAASLASAYSAQTLASELEGVTLVPIVQPVEVNQVPVTEEDTVYLIDCPLSVDHLYRGRFYAAKQVHAVYSSVSSVLQRAFVACNEIPERLDLTIAHPEMPLYQAVAAKFNCFAIDSDLNHALCAYHHSKTPHNPVYHLILGYTANRLMPYVVKTTGWLKRTREYMEMESALLPSVAGRADLAEIVVSGQGWSKIDGLAYCAPSLLSLELTAAALYEQSDKSSLQIAWRPLQGRMIIATAVELEQNPPYAHEIINIVQHEGKQMTTWTMTAQNFFTYWVR